MLAEGLWSRERKRQKRRRRRERKEHFGELVQMDGSFHPWLEKRGPEGRLIDMADDATNTTFAKLGKQETIWAEADALRAWIERYGVPLALYVDWKNLYKRTVVGALREDADLEFRTDFFNAFNHPQFSNPTSNVGSASTFGVITTTSVGPRIVQFALKYAF